MTDPTANYLSKTAPNQESAFLKAMGQVPLFGNLPKELLSYIYKYSKFIKLQNGDRPIKQNMFDQEIFILIDGNLNVFLTDKFGEEEKIDIIGQPFTVFGERCILGEPRGASIEATGEVLLLGIDLSSLPDFLEVLENPDSKGKDDDYKNSAQMYSVFATVLMERLGVLVKDQQKLLCRFEDLHETIPFKKTSTLKTHIFNNFTENNLADTLCSHRSLRKFFRSYDSDNLDRILESSPVNTKDLYFELTKLESRGKIPNLYLLLKEVIGKIAIQAKFLPEYRDFLPIEIVSLPEILPLSDFFYDLHHHITEANLIPHRSSKNQFLEDFVSHSALNPAVFGSFLKEQREISDQFGLSHLFFLIIQRCIYKVAECNQRISTYVKFLSAFDSTPSKRKDFVHQALMDEFYQLYESTIEDKVETPQKKETSSKKKRW